MADQIAGVTWSRIVRHADERGSFRELWREADFPSLTPAEGRLGAAPDDPGPRFVQANLSVSAAGVLRGLHVHRRQLDHWIVASGRAFVALVDLRQALRDGPGSGSSPPMVETRTLEADSAVTIPSGVAHGFLALEPLELIYLVTTAYDGSDELGFAWDDAAVGVPWPALPDLPGGRPMVSERDRHNPPLAELIARQGDG